MSTSRRAGGVVDEVRPVREDDPVKVTGSGGIRAGTTRVTDGKTLDGSAQRTSDAFDTLTDTVKVKAAKASPKSTVLMVK
ncbi:hypothetical protein [Actinacidiphila sp. ITFR-21]|uniref:hypothetical protein n=1 Tax=Actinacidiphila sp. ITFR-21 TaxID=3075199 RepID=UPI00288B0E18|nr:hypothetical protein [Streptomyces sp. ITFR-21]WNI18040.1 hypothetical protein RLT57_22475 [Streptomyces sp. ITFR-21]